MNWLALVRNGSRMYRSFSCQQTSRIWWRKALTRFRLQNPRWLFCAAFLSACRQEKRKRRAADLRPCQPAASSARGVIWLNAACRRIVAQTNKAMKALPFTSEALPLDELSGDFGMTLVAHCQLSLIQEKAWRRAPS